MIFDYIYLRMYRYFERKRDTTTPEWLAIMTLSYFQTMIVFDSTIIWSMIAGTDSLPKYGVLVVLVLFGAVNFLRYQYNFDPENIYKPRKQETYNQEVSRGWIILILFVIVCTFPVVMGISKHS